MKKLILLMTALILSTSPSFAALRKFTDVEGRTIQAQYIRSNGEIVHIRRADGQVFATPLARFDPRTQGMILFLEEQSFWRAYNLLTSADGISPAELRENPQVLQLVPGEEIMVRGRLERIREPRTRGQSRLGAGPQPVNNPNPEFEFQLDGLRAHVKFSETSTDRRIRQNGQRIVREQGTHRWREVETLASVGQTVVLIGRLANGFLEDARFADSHERTAFRMKMVARFSPREFEDTVRIEQLQTDIRRLEEEIRSGVSGTSTGSISSSSRGVVGSMSTTHRFTEAQIEAKRGELAIKKAQLEAYLSR